MQLISGLRRSGKTTRCVDWVKENGGIIITFNAIEADRVCKRFGLSRNRVLTWREVYTNKVLLGRHGAKICIDNVELVLAQFLGIHIDAVSMTHEEGK